MWLHLARRFTLLTALTLLPVYSCSRVFAQQAASSQEVLIENLLHEIQYGLATAQKQLAAEKMPPLQSVTLDLVAETKVSAGGKINLYIVSFGKKWERDRSHEVEVTLKPPSPNLPLSVGKEPSVSEELVSAIVSAARGVEAARNNKDVPLQTSGLKVVLNFVIKVDTSSGLKFTIVPVTADLSGDLTKQAIQKITVVYQNPEPKK